MNTTIPFRKPEHRLSTPVRVGVAAVAACFLAAPALSNPVNPTVVNGTASFNQVGNVLTVTNSNGAIINWDKFSIKAGETTHFAQSSASSSVLNRVLNDPSAIYGTLSSNGRVWLINPAGIMVGAGGRVDTAAFVASTLNIRNEDFLAGRHLFINDGNAKDVINQGEIRTPAGGSVYLIGSNVKNESVAGEPNSGIISTPGGETILAAGATVSLIDSALPGIKVDVTGATGNATNLGTITAEAGRIGIAGVIVRNSGTLNASSVVNDGGRIFLKASQDAYVDGNGRIVTTGTKGGSVEVLGNRVAVMDHASIDASGTTGGGTIKVGGDYQGKNPDIQNANITYFGPEASLKANATEVGAGGTVIVWADDTTRAHGNISARGGSLGGKGGFVETSGKRYLDVLGISVNPGAGGEWLLDPERLTIVHATSGSAMAGNPFDPASYGGSLSDYSINLAINAASSVTIQTTDATDGGRIYFDGTSAGAIVIDKTTNSFNSTLAFNANNGIVFDGSTTFKTSGSGLELIVQLNPGSGQITSNSGSTVTFNGAGSGSATAEIIGQHTWNNNGTLTLDGKSGLKIFDSGSTTYGTFNNYGTLNINSTNQWSLLSLNSTQNGLLNNYGTVNVNGAYGGNATSWEAKYFQGSGGKLNIAAGKQLSMQHMDTVYGSVSIGAGSTLNVSENHAGAETFYNSKIYLASGATFTPSVGVTFNQVNLFATGDYTVPTTNITYAGIDNSIYATGNLTYSSGITGYTGELAFGAGGNITINGALSANYVALVAGVGQTIFDSGEFDNLSFDQSIDKVYAGYYTPTTGSKIDINAAVTATKTLGLAGYDININGGGKVVSSEGNVKAIASNNITLTGGYGGGYINAGDDVKLKLTGSASTLYLNPTSGSSYDAYILSDTFTGVQATTYLDFPNRTSGGVIIDGIETMTTVVGGSGFFAVNTSTPAVAGAGLQIAYSGTTLDICVLSPSLCKPPPPTDTPIDKPPPSFEITGPGGTQPGSGTGGTTAGGTEGSFGGDDSGGNGDKKDDKKDDKDKDKKADNGKDGKKDDKPGQKKVAQCS